MKTHKKQKVFIKTESKTISDLRSNDRGMRKGKNLTGQARKRRDTLRNFGRYFSLRSFLKELNYFNDFHV